MKNYWDSSALVAVCQDEEVADRFWAAEGVTRSHSFAEVFSTLTGGRLGFRVDAEKSAGLIRDLAANLSICDLKASELLVVLGEARAKGVRGGRVHDYLHAASAMKAECSRLVTYNLSDFVELYDELEVLEPEDL